MGCHSSVSVSVLVFSLSVHLSRCLIICIMTWQCGWNFMSTEPISAGCLSNLMPFPCTAMICVCDEQMASHAVTHALLPLSVRNAGSVATATAACCTLPLICTRPWYQRHVLPATNITDTDTAEVHKHKDCQAA
jgi:hypothetical protein